MYHRIIDIVLVKYGKTFLHYYRQITVHEKRNILHALSSFIISFEWFVSYDFYLLDNYRRLVD